MESASNGPWWRKLFGLSEPKAPSRPAGGAIHPRHSATGEVVTGREPDWGRYDNCMRMSVVGESHYQDALIRVSECPPSGEHSYECSAELVPEPDNEVDKFAVMVLVKGEKVGYLSRGNAKRYHRKLAELRSKRRPTICMAYIGRAEDDSPLGVSLRLPYDGEILG